MDFFFQQAGVKKRGSRVSLVLIIPLGLKPVRINFSAMFHTVTLRECLIMGLAVLSIFKKSNYVCLPFLDYGDG